MNLTIVTPTKLQCEEDFKTLIWCLRSLYRTIDKKSVVHHFSCLDQPRFHSQLTGFLEGQHIRYKIVSSGTNYLDAFLSLTGSVETKYYCFQSADVSIVTNKNVLQLCIDAMEIDDKIIQVRYGGYPFASFENNIKYIVSVDNGICFNDHNKEKLFPIELSQTDTVWTHSMLASNQELLYGWPVWCCVIRTDVLQRVTQLARQQLLPSEKSMSDILAKICWTRDLVGYCLHTKDWPANIKWIEQYRQGFLNLANYSCPLGRVKSEEDMVRNHQHEIRTVDELIRTRGELYAKA